MEINRFYQRIENKKDGSSSPDTSVSPAAKAAASAHTDTPAEPVVKKAENEMVTLEKKETAENLNTKEVMAVHADVYEKDGKLVKK